MFSHTLQCARQLLNRHNLTCIVTLWAFVASSVGLPLTPLGQPTSHCRCRDELKSAGQCCCSNAKDSITASSCCETPKKTVAETSCCKRQRTCFTKPHSTPQSCCAREPKSSRPSTAPSPCSDSFRAKVPAISACGCGVPSDAALATSAEPRSLGAVVMVVDHPNSERWLPPLETIPSGPSLPPETPPPKVPLAQTLFV